MDAKTIEWIIGGALIIGLLLFSWWAMEESHRRLNDPDDDRTLHLDRLPGKLALLPFGIYRVNIFRQSGNIHAETIVTGTAQAALAEAMATFRRAKIDAVHVATNSERELRIGRLYHDHRGRNEGKKVGKAHITLLERAEPRQAPEPDLAVEAAPSEPSIIVEPIGITCDCGTRIEVEFAEIGRERACPSCGRDATLTPVQVAQIETAAGEAKAEALARYRAGETGIHVQRTSKLTEGEAS